MRKVRCLLFKVCFVFIFSGVALGATLTVPAQYPDVQSAMDAAVAGDTVLLQAGVYEEYITFKSSVTLKGESREAVVLKGVDWTVIDARDCEYGSVENLTLQNEGDYNPWNLSSVGAYVEYSSIDFVNVDVKGFGQGVYYVGELIQKRGSYSYDIYAVPERVPAVEGCSFSGNGTALSMIGMYPTVMNSSFTDNTGYAVYARENSHPLIEKNVFTGNSYAVHASRYSGPLVLDNEIVENSRGFSYSWTGRGEIRGNNISGNLYDGLWLVTYSYPLVRNNIISRNGQEGIWLYVSYPKVYNNTIVENGGDGFYATYYGRGEIRNNVIAFNGGWGGNTGPIYWGGYPMFSYNDIYGNGAGSTSANIRLYSGNIFLDPLLRDRENQNYQLGFGSPSIDAGDPAPGYNDPDGSRNDIGAYGGPFALPKDPFDPADLVPGLIDKMVALPDHAFKNEPANRKNAIENKLTEVLLKIEAGDAAQDVQTKREYYEDALKKLEKDLLQKCDGHFGGNPRNDWITTEEAQSAVYPIIINLISSLNVLLNTI